VDFKQGDKPRRTDGGGADRGRLRASAPDQVHGSGNSSAGSRFGVQIFNNHRRDLTPGGVGCAVYGRRGLGMGGGSSLNIRASFGTTNNHDWPRRGGDQPRSARNGLRSRLRFRRAVTGVLQEGARRPWFSKFNRPLGTGPGVFPVVKRGSVGLAVQRAERSQRTLQTSGREIRHPCRSVRRSVVGTFFL